MNSSDTVDLESPQRLTRTRRWLDRTEYAVGILVTLVALLLFFVRFAHAGPLWRDEAESIQSSQMPFPEMVETVQFSSFPLLFPLVLRVYSVLFGSADASLRFFGAGVGILFLIAAWWPIRKLTGKVPLFLLAMIGLNANFLISGMGLRGYGFGSLLMLLAVAFHVAFMRNPSLLAFLGLIIADLACAHVLFLNLPVVAGFTAAIGCVLLMDRKPKWSAGLAFLIAIIGVSYAFYILQFYRSGRVWGEILHVPMSVALIWEAFFAAWGNISAWVSSTWIALLGITLVGALWLLRPLGNESKALRASLIFAILAMIVATAASYLFVRMLPRQPESRYFLALSIAIAAVMDLIWTYFPSWMRAGRIGVVLVGVMTVPESVWGWIVQAESNSEIVARAVEREIGSSDLIVVNPWSYGVSFNWYYRGANRFVTVPPIEDHRVHRYDLLWQKMQSPAPLAGVESEVESALKSGNRVWFVGQLELPASGEKPFQIGPAPDSNFGWQAAPYRKAWSEQLGFFLVQHVAQGTPVELGSAKYPVSPRENMTLFRLEGWKD